MELGPYAQSCATAYRDIGEQNGWRKGRNSSRGYDLLTLPSAAWDDRPHDRYLLVLNNHLSSAAVQLEACGGCYGAGNAHAVLTLAREVFVESTKASWLLESGIPWMQRAARAHLELLANLDAHVRLLPKRLEEGYPSFRRRQWKFYRDQLREEVIEELFGKRALSKKPPAQRAAQARDEMTLVGEALLTSAQLEADFAELLSVSGFDALKGGYVAAPDVLIDPLAPLDLDLSSPIVAEQAMVEQSFVTAIRVWLAALDAWVRYNAWETAVVDRLTDQLTRLLGPPT